MELNLIHPSDSKHPKMHDNDSGKFECSFLNVDIPQNKSIMLETLSSSRLGIWIAHGEGKFTFPNSIDKYNVVMKYSYSGYPGNPNGSEHDVAGICSSDGRHLAMMPHLERTIYPWNWAHYPNDRKEDEVSPWIEAFVNAKNWIQNQQ
jgi:phosphoribosylformylglycinamidine synthase